MWDWWPPVNYIAIELTWWTTLELTAAAVVWGAIMSFLGIWGEEHGAHGMAIIGVVIGSILGTVGISALALGLIP